VYFHNIFKQFYCKPDLSFVVTLVLLTLQLFEYNLPKNITKNLQSQFSGGSAAAMDHHTAVGVTVPSQMIRQEHVAAGSLHQV